MLKMRSWPVVKPGRLDREWRRSPLAGRRVLGRVMASGHFIIRAHTTGRAGTPRGMASALARATSGGVAMRGIFRTLLAGYGAKKLGGGCVSTIVIFLILYWLLGRV